MPVRAMRNPIVPFFLYAIPVFLYEVINRMIEKGVKFISHEPSHIRLFDIDTMQDVIRATKT